MNRIVTVLAVLASIGMASAQQLDPAHLTVTGVAAIGPAIEAGAANSGALSCVGTSAPAFASPQATDTLADHFLRSTAFRNYIYRDNNNNAFPVVGANTLYLFVGQKFPISGSPKVLGVLMAVAMARPAPPADTLSVNIFPGSPSTGLPSGQTIGFGRFLTSDVDTSSLQPVFTYIPMEADTYVSGPFVAVVRTRMLTNNDDPFMIWSNQQGDGRQENRACYITVQNNQLVANNLGQLINMGGAPLDVDVMLLPVVEGDVTGVDHVARIEGMTFRGIAPQPAADRALVSLRADRPMQVTIDVIDAVGHVVIPAREHELRQGDNALPVDASSLAAGAYFVRIVRAGTAIATPLRIAR